MKTYISTSIILYNIRKFKYKFFAVCPAEAGVSDGFAVDSASRFVRDTVDMSTEYPTPIREGVALEAALGNLIK